MQATGTCINPGKPHQPRTHAAGFGYTTRRTPPAPTHLWAPGAPTQPPGRRSWGREVPWHVLLRHGDRPNFAGTCSNPVEIHVVSTFSAITGDRRRERKHACMGVRCRKCRECGLALKAHWKHRTVQEIAIGRRSRWITWTFAVPHSPQEAHAEITRAFKRIREANPDKPFAYIVVLERGENATKRVHAHAIVVEHGDNLGSRAYRQRNRENPHGQWLAGFAKVRDIKPGDDGLRHASYLAKYLAKGLDTRRLGERRIRASNYWGNRRPLPPQRETAPPIALRDFAEAMLQAHPDLPAQSARPPQAQPGDPLLPQPTQHPDGTGTAVTCAFYLKSPPPAGPPTHKTGPPSGPIAALAHHEEWRGCTFRLLEPEEIPPEIRKSWFGGTSS